MACGCGKKKVTPIIKKDGKQINKPADGGGDKPARR